MSYCKSCRWWKRDGYPNDDFGHCELTVSTNGRPAHSESVAWIDGLTKLTQSLYCHEKYGCVKHAAAQSALPGM